MSTACVTSTVVLQGQPYIIPRTWGTLSAPARRSEARGSSLRSMRREFNQRDRNDDYEQPEEHDDIERAAALTGAHMKGTRGRLADNAAVE